MFQFPFIVLSPECLYGVFYFVFAWVDLLNFEVKRKRKMVNWSVKTNLKSKSLRLFLFANLLSPALMKRFRDRGSVQNNKRSGQSRKTAEHKNQLIKWRAVTNLFSTATDILARSDDESWTECEGAHCQTTPQWRRTPWTPCRLKAADLEEEPAHPIEVCTGTSTLDHPRLGQGSVEWWIQVRTLLIRWSIVCSEV